MAFDQLDQATQSLYGLNEPRRQTGLAQQFPYSYESGSTYGQVPAGGQQGSQNFMSAIGPMVGSLMAPNQSQGQQQQQAPPPPTQTANVPQYQFGDSEGDDAGQESQQFASSIGQGVLAASQAAAAQAGGKGGKKKGGGFGGGGGMDEGTAMGFAGAA